MTKIKQWKNCGFIPSPKAGRGDGGEGQAKEVDGLFIYDLMPHFLYGKE